MASCVMNHRIKYMKNLLYILTLILTFSGFAVHAQSDYISYEHNADYILADISVRSNNENIDKAYIKLLSGLVIGDKISVPGKEITKAMRKLWDEKIFSDVKISVLNATEG